MGGWLWIVRELRKSLLCQTSKRMSFELGDHVLKMQRLTHAFTGNMCSGSSSTVSNWNCTRLLILMSELSRKGSFQCVDILSIYDRSNAELRVQFVYDENTKY